MTFEPDRALAREHKACRLLRKVIDNQERHGTLPTCEEGNAKLNRAQAAIERQDDASARVMLTELMERFERGLATGREPYHDAQRLYREIKAALEAEA